jgi:hypothetical protein
MTALRVRSFSVVALAVALVVAPAMAQVPNFDDRPTGFLSLSAGGMPPDSWGGTSLGTAKRLVSALPAAPRSRALRDVQFKVMVSELAPPAPDGSPPPSLFARKVDRLAAMGEAENLNEMVRSAGGYADPAVAAAVVNSLMLAGEKEGACAIVHKHPLPEPFKRRADVACKLVSGDNAGAMEAAAALRGGDPALVKLVEIAAQGLPPSAVPPTRLDGPAMVMLDLAYVAPSAAALRTTEPSLMRALVAHRTLPAATRIDISERGEALAIIEATKLGDLYIQALRDGVVMPAPTARRARLVTAARRAANAQEIVDSIIAVYGESRGGALFPTVARASAIGLLNLPADEQFANVAQEAMRGFLLLGDKKRTKAWTELAVKAAHNDARATNALDRLLPLVAIAGVDDPKRLPSEDINRWYQIMRQDDPARAPLRGYLLLELFRATGIDVPRGSTQLPETPPAGAYLVSPPLATMQALQAAASGRRRAETALLASIAVGETPLTNLHPAAVGAIVRALRQVGEDHAARLYAVETAIAHGL